MYKSLQACRAVAALLVVLHHLGFALASPKYFGVSSLRLPFIWGDSGVEFFFVLSGFIITWAHYGDIGVSAALPRYLRKRLIRIYPSYWIVAGIAVIAAATSTKLSSALPHDVPTLLKSLALLPQDKYVVGGSGSPLLTVAWTLQYEICFYALFAAFILSRPLGMLISIALVFNYGMCHANVCRFPEAFFADDLVLLFGAGGLMAIASKRSMLLPRPLSVAIVAGCAFLCYGIFEARFGTAILPFDRRMAFGGLSAIIIFALVQAENGGQLRITSRMISILGDSSYALYLIHFPLIALLCKLSVSIGLAGASGALIAYPVILVACLVAAIAFHLLVERPILEAWSGHRADSSLAALKAVR